MSRFRIFDLNTAQLEAVQHEEGPLLILAGAGTGKTRTITARIAWLIAQGEDPSKIRAVTFTNKAAREMKERMAEMVEPAQAKLVWASDVPCALLENPSRRCAASRLQSKFQHLRRKRPAGL